MTDHVREITRPRIFFEYACQFYYGFLVNFLKFILIFFFNVSDRDRVGIPMRKLLLVFLTFPRKRYVSIREFLSYKGISNTSDAFLSYKGITIRCDASIINQ